MYRLPRCLALDFLDLLSPNMDGENLCPDIPLAIQFCSVLNFLASGSYQRRVGSDGFTMLSQTCVSRAVRSITQVVATRMMDDFIKFPDSIEEIEELERDFQEIADFPGAFLLVDGTQTRVAALSREIEFAFVNRKGFHSINTQIAGDSRMRVRAINARYPGSTHDSFIWKCSMAHRVIRQMYADMNGNFNYYLLGDNGYPLQPWLLKPYDQPCRSRAEKVFNRQHKRLRSLIERIIGLLKGRFRCMLGERALRYDHERSANIIYTCAVLHNFLIDNGYPINDIQPVFDDYNGYVHHQSATADLARGRIIRDTVAQYFINSGY